MRSTTSNAAMSASAATAVIGRDAEMSEVLNMVTAHRVVTLIGTGGIGKTRLSLGVARQLLGRQANNYREMMQRRFYGWREVMGLSAV